MDFINLKLKESVSIYEFDTSSKKKKYVLTCDNKRWVIGEFTYNIVKLIDGNRNIEQLTKDVSNTMIRKVEEEEVTYIVEEFLIKRGILENTVDKLKSRSSSSYMWLKIPLIKSEVIEKFKLLEYLYYKKIAIPIIIFSTFSIIISCICLLKSGITFINIKNTKKTIYFAFLISIYFSTIFHEFGHAAASMYYNIKPGNIGFTIYFIYPCFFADVSETWKLKKAQRAIVDIGGIYFQYIYYAIFSFFGVIFNNNLLILISLFGLITCLSTFNPFIKMDGYWMISDIIGIPNLHKTMGRFLIQKCRNFLKKDSKKNILNEFNERAKRIFIFYTYCNVIFNTLFLISLCRIMYTTTKSIYILFNNMFLLQNCNLRNLSSVTYKDILTIISFILLFKIIMTFFKKLKKGLVAILK